MMALLSFVDSVIAILQVLADVLGVIREGELAGVTARPIRANGPADGGAPILNLGLDVLIYRCVFIFSVGIGNRVDLAAELAAFSVSDVVLAVTDAMPIVVFAQNSAH
eukprot:196417_1